MSTGETKHPGLIEFLLADEVEALREKRREVERAREELEHITRRIAEVDMELTRLSVPRSVDIEVAAARLLGEAPPATAEADSRQTPVDPNELRNGLLGLRTRRQAAEQHLGVVEGRFRGAVVDAMRKGANRAAERYVETAKELGDLWALLDAVQQIGEQAGMRLLRVEWWRGVRIPGTKSADLPALTQASREVWGEGPVVFTGRDAAERGVGARSSRAIAEAFRNEVGAWPFDRRQ